LPAGEFVDFREQLEAAASQDQALAVGLHAVLAQSLQLRGETREAQGRWAKTGLIQEANWLVVGPFENIRGEGFDYPYRPERAVDLRETYWGVDKRVTWKPGVDKEPEGYLDFQAVLQEWYGLAYAAAYLTSPDPRQAQLMLETNNAVKVWLNGQQVLSHPGEPDGWMPEPPLRAAEYLVPVAVKSGRNEILVTVDERSDGWEGHVGVVTTLFPQVRIDPVRTVVVALVGPPVMYRFVLTELNAMAVPEEQMFFSLERRMKCGVGKCGHCQVDGRYVCIDGPVFSARDIRTMRESV